jgi:propanol-preferring alcohol dehydrogenase
MKAAVVREFGAPLVIEERADPEPGPGQIVVGIEVTGLCHTDIHAANGDWPVKPAPPFIPGHEGVGLVTGIGEGVTGITVGDRVAVPWLGRACGRCEHCLTGWETLCTEQLNTGYSIDGTFADTVLAYADYVGRVPEGIDPAEAAPLTCAGVTTYKAIKVADIGPTDLVLISGIGGLGHLALQYAKLAGATVAAVDVTDDKLALATELGADLVIDARSQDVAKVMQSHGGANAAIGLAVDGKSFETAFTSLRRGGRLVLVALPSHGTIQLPVFDTVLGGLSVIGSIVGTRQDLAEVFSLHAAGRTRVIQQTRPLSEVNTAISDVLAGRAPARIVLQP